MERIREIVEDMNRILAERKARVRANLIALYGHKYKEVERLHEYDQQSRDAEEKINFKKKPQGTVGLGD